MPKPKVLLFIDYYLPGYKAGGPVRTIANIVDTLKKQVSFFIVTRNHDLGETAAYADIIPNTWVQQSDYRIIYLDRKHTNIDFFRSLLLEQAYDTIYFNSLFSVKFTLLPLLVAKKLKVKARLMLAPRGMLGSGALQLKATKKKLFLRLAKVSGLFQGITWHASTHFEEEEIKHNFGQHVKVQIAIDLASVPADQPAYREKIPGKASFFFISRISPKKNLMGGLKALTQLKNFEAVDFKIIGPVEDEAYWQECQQIIKQMPAGITVNFVGPVPYPQVPAAIDGSHFFLFPTFSENYGHVIIEALSGGCPVILSDQTPWRNLEEYQVGWDIAIQDKQKLVEIIHRCVQMGQEEFSAMSLKTVSFLREQVLTEEVVEQNKRLFAG